MANTRIKSILAVVSDPFAKQQLAAEKAAAIAMTTGASLTLLNTFMIPQPVAEKSSSSHRQMLAAATEQRRQQLEKLAARWRKKKLSVLVQVAWDHPTHEAIIRAVLRDQPDLLFVHSHRRGRFARWLLANTDWELIRQCPCPVWFVRSERHPREPEFLVAIDPFHSHEKPARLDARLLQSATALAAQLDGQVDVAHALNATSPSMSSRALNDSPSVAYACVDEEKHARRAVLEIAGRYAIHAERCHVVRGEPGSVLPALVSELGVDVLVMGAVSRSALKASVIGSTAERVIDEVDCDLLIVKPTGFKTTVPKVRAR